jgi:uncharacterized membrane protein
VPAELAVAHATEDNESFGLAATFALALIGYAWVYGALLATISRPTRSPLEPYGRTVDRVPALVVASFVAGLAIVLGLLLLIIPGLVIAARLSAATPLIVLERLGPVKALETSNGLVRGHTRTVIGAVLIVLLAALVLAVPGALIAELAESPWAKGLGNALLDVGLDLPIAALTYAIYRQLRGSVDAPAARH